MYSICLTSTSEYTADQAARADFLESCIIEMAIGNQDALSALYEQTKTAVYGFVLSILKNKADADDVLQETYVRAYTAAGSYQPRQKPMAWILTIAKNLARMRMRSENRHYISLSDCELEDVYADYPQCSSEDRLMLNTALLLLTDEERQIIMLHAVGGLKHREIAALLDLPLPTVLSKYRRSLHKLKQKLMEEEEAL